LQLPAGQISAALAEVTSREYSEFPESLERIRTGLGNLPIVLFPEVESTLASVKSKGFALVFSSSTPRPIVEARLEALGIRPYFDVALGMDLPEGMTKADHPRLTREQLGMSEQEFKAAAVYLGTQREIWRWQSRRYRRHWPAYGRQ
jgi:phosphoglycolate phosphatase-like HAD superfamily hydrolase